MTQSTIERLPTVLNRLGVSRSTLYNLIKQKRFKAPIQLSARARGWLSTDVDEYIQSQTQASRNQQVQV